MRWYGLYLAEAGRRYDFSSIRDPIEYKQDLAAHLEEGRHDDDGVEEAKDEQEVVDKESCCFVPKCAQSTWVPQTSREDAQEKKANKFYSETRFLKWKGTIVKRRREREKQVKSKKKSSCVSP